MTRKTLALRFLTHTAVMAVVIASSARVRSQETAAPTPAPPGTPTMTAAEFDQMFKEVSNWGRWGKDDKLGALNLITDTKRKAAAALVKAGIAVSIAHTMSTEKDADNPNPIVLNMQPSFRADTLTIAYHGTFVTHFDSLCHFAYEDKLYNGIPVSEGSLKGCAN